MTKLERLHEARAALAAAEAKVEKMRAHYEGAQQSLREAQAAMSLADAMPDDPEPVAADPGLPMAGGSAAAHNPTVLTQDYTG